MGKNKEAPAAEQDPEDRVLKTVVTVGMLIKALLFLSTVLVGIGVYEIKRLDDVDSGIGKMGERVAKIEAVASAQPAASAMVQQISASIISAVHDPKAQAASTPPALAPPPAASSR